MSRKKCVKIGVAFFLLVLFFVCAQFIRIHQLVKRTAYTAEPFTQVRANASRHILFLGDSTAVGIGSVDPQQSTAGWLAHDFPQADIDNVSFNGIKIRGLHKRFDEIPRSRYDVVIVQVGANDVIKLTPFKQIRSDFEQLIQELQTYSDHLIVLHSGDIGTSPMFIWPFTRILSHRSYKIRALYQAYAHKYGFAYVDLIGMNIDQTFLDRVQEYYAPDLLHLSGKGYKVWYEAIRKDVFRQDIVF